MRYALFFLGFMVLVGCRSHSYTNEYVHNSIVGTWSIGTDSMPKVFRFVRTDTFQKHRRGFVFYGDGRLDYYGPWGCQTPPNFRDYKGSWEVDKRGRIVIDIYMFPDTEVHWEIVTLKPKLLRFTTDVVL